MARVTGRNLNLFTVDGEPLATNIRECTINVDRETQENTALLDDDHYMIPVRSNWSVDFTLAVTNSLDHDSTSRTNVAAMMVLLNSGASVAFTVETGSAAANGVRYNGTGLLTSGRHGVPTTDLQEASFTIVPQGALTITQL